MEKKGHHLTNENLAKKFNNNFELVNYAIRLAENMIKSGRDARVKSEIQNRAMLILEEINEGKDQFDKIPEAASSQGEQSTFHGDEPAPKYVAEEKTERRKGKFSFSDID